MDRIVTFSFRDRENLGHLDLESLEIYIRSSMHSVGSVILEKAGLYYYDEGCQRGWCPKDKALDMVRSSLSSKDLCDRRWISLDIEYCYCGGALLWSNSGD